MTTVLGIETSCDETAASVVVDGKKILSNVVASSSDLHKKTGGIIPENAAREQIVSIIPVIKEAIKDAFGNSNDTSNIDQIAVTTGPGLIGSLLVGVETAKTLSLVWEKPICPVNHLKGHIYASWLENENPPEFPALSLVVSGGHTDLVLLTSHTNIKWVGGTRDDAAGEAFDKTARLLGLSYPGGPEISNRADKFLEKNSQEKLKLFPRPMIDADNFEWSFSGLKTAVLNEVEEVSVISKEKVNELSAQIQEAIVDVLVTKSVKAIKAYKPKSFVLSGGVAANTKLRDKFAVKLDKVGHKTKLFIPPPNLCTDNAAYIAARSFYTKPEKDWKHVKAIPELAINELP